MDSEKIINSKIYSFFDWLWKLFVLNTLTLITSLLIVTILPSLSACYASIKDFKDSNDNKFIFKTYFSNFKKLFKKSFIIGIIFIILFALFGYAISYYSLLAQAENFKLDTSGVIIYIFYYFSVFLLIMIFILFNQMPMAFTYFNFRFKDNFKFCFLIGFKYLWKSFLIVLGWVIAFVLFFITMTLPIWFFFGISIPMYNTFRNMGPIYNYLIKNKNDVQIIEEE